MFLIYSDVPWGDDGETCKYDATTTPATAVVMGFETLPHNDLDSVMYHLANVGNIFIKGIIHIIFVTIHAKMTICNFILFLLSSSIYKFGLYVWVSDCLFVSNKCQNG